MRENVPLREVCIINVEASDFLCIILVYYMWHVKTKVKSHYLLYLTYIVQYLRKLYQIIALNINININIKCMCSRRGDSPKKKLTTATLAIISY